MDLLTQMTTIFRPTTGGPPLYLNIRNSTKLYDLKMNQIKFNKIYNQCTETVMVNLFQSFFLWMLLRLNNCIDFTIKTRLYLIFKVVDYQGPYTGVTVLSGNGCERDNGTCRDVCFIRISSKVRKIWCEKNHFFTLLEIRIKKTPWHVPLSLLQPFPDKTITSPRI